MAGVAAIGIPVLASRATGLVNPNNLTAGCSNLNLTAGCALNLTAGNNVVAECNVIVDASLKNTGGLTPGLIFGLCTNENHATSGISSSQAVGSPNVGGLDFYTQNTKWMSLNNAGCVSINQFPPGTCSAVNSLPAGTLTVSTTVAALSLDNLGPAPGRPAVVGNSGLGSGVIGTTAFIPCIKTILPCVMPAGVQGLTVGAGGDYRTGKGIGVRGASSGGPGISGNSCASTGVVGTTGALLPCIKTILPCIRAPDLCTAGVTGLSLGPTGTLASSKAIGVKGVSSGGPGIAGSSCLSSGVVGTTGAFIPCLRTFLPCLKSPTTCSAAGVTGLSVSPTGCLSTGNGIGVKGISAAGPALQGKSVSNVAVCAQSNSATIGRFSNTGKAGDRSALVQFQPAQCTAVTGAGACIQTWNAGVSGPGNLCLVPPGSFYIGKQGAKPTVIVNPTGIQVKGSISACGGISNNGGLTARTISVSGNSTQQSYQMQASCFAVLADASGVPGGPGKGNGGTFTVNLPPAASSQGMMVFIKRTDSSKNTLNIAAGKGDTIEGGASETLGKQFDAIQLISDGKNTWYEISSY